MLKRMLFFPRSLKTISSIHEDGSSLLVPVVPELCKAVFLSVHENNTLHVACLTLA